MTGPWGNLYKTLIMLFVLSITLNSLLWNQVESSRIQLDTTINQLEIAGREQTETINWYSDLRDQINIRLGQGQDTRSFITPDDPSIAAKVREITEGPAQDAGNYWVDCYRIYCWVAYHTHYTADSYTPVLPGAVNGPLEWRSDFWRTPAETLKDGAGDCEDMAVLLASMLMNYTQGESDIWVLGIKTTTPDPKGHVAVVLPVDGNKLAILDPYGGYCTWDYQENEFVFNNISVAVNRWLLNWAHDMPDAHVFEVFSDQFHHYFDSTEAFINWVIER